MDLAPDFKDLLEEFARGKVDFVIVGGYAVAFHGHPRATKDIDLVLEGSVENLGRAADALARFGATATVVDAVRALRPSEIAFMGQPPLRTDFLRRIDGVTEADLFAHAVAAVLDGIPVKVIAIDDLLANKRAAARPQDLVDAQFLERIRAKEAR